VDEEVYWHAQKYQRHFRTALRIIHRTASRPGPFRICQWNDPGRAAAFRRTGIKACLIAARPDRRRRKRFGGLFSQEIDRRTWHWRTSLIRVKPGHSLFVFKFSENGCPGFLPGFLLTNDIVVLPGIHSSGQEMRICRHLTVA